MDERTSHELAYKKGYEQGKPKWIPVTERLPELETYVYSVDVLFLDTDGVVRVGYANLELGNWKTQETRRIIAKENVTHWMPLPEPPKGE